MLVLGAKFEQARGDNNRAADYYRASLSAMPPPDPGEELATELSTAAGTGSGNTSTTLTSKPAESTQPSGSCDAACTRQGRNQDRRSPRRRLSSVNPTVSAQLRNGRRAGDAGRRIWRPVWRAGRRVAPRQASQRPTRPRLALPSNNDQSGRPAAASGAGPGRQRGQRVTHAPAGLRAAGNSGQGAADVCASGRHSASFRGAGSASRTARMQEVREAATLVLSSALFPVANSCARDRRWLICQQPAAQQQQGTQLQQQASRTRDDQQVRTADDAAKRCAHRQVSPPAEGRSGYRWRKFTAPTCRTMRLLPLAFRSLAALGD